MEFIRRRIIEGKISDVAINKLYSNNLDIKFCSKYDKRRLWRVFGREIIQTEFYF